MVNGVEARGSALFAPRGNESQHVDSGTVKNKGRVQVTSERGEKNSKIAKGGYPN